MADQKYPRASLAAWHQSRYPGDQMNANTGVVHTTEGTTLPSYGGGASAPTFTLVPSLASKTVAVFQHFDVDRSARAACRWRAASPGAGLRTRSSKPPGRTAAT